MKIRRIFLLVAGLAATGVSCGPAAERAASTIDPTATATRAATSGPWYGAELRSRAEYGRRGTPLRITWRSVPAPGNCVITVFSLFNADRIFATNQGQWSELAFEIFGGSSRGSGAALQTQYITYENLGEPSSARGRQHLQEHLVGSEVPPLWDGEAHEFQIEWRPDDTEAAYIVFRIDGVEIRREHGGDVARLEPGLKMHTSAWVARTDIMWGCTDESDRPESSTAVVDALTIEENTEGAWVAVVEQSFSSAEAIDDDFDRSTSSWEAYDGQHCPASAVWDGHSAVNLEVKRSC